MEDENRAKIEATVTEILKNANMEEITECNVRVTAAERLGMELSYIEEHHKIHIKNIIESFLLSTATEKDLEEAQREFAADVVKSKKNVIGNVIFKLSKKWNVVIQDKEGQKVVTIGEYVERKGKHKGINFTHEQWSNMKKNIPLIDEAVKKMQTKLRSTASVQEFVPVETIRFDGKNYEAWAPVMETFLKQLNVAYVLTVPGPSPRPEATRSEKAKDSETKWKNDDYICRHNILSCLSDHLYNQFLKKTKSAKELWERLKLVYQTEEYETRRCNVKRYIEYQMVEDKPITVQVRDLNRIADSIVAVGWLIDENFHVSTIISKLPPSWKDFSLKLSREENLPFMGLMELIRVEEVIRNPNYKQPEASNFTEFHPGKFHGGPRNIREVRIPPTPRNWKRPETGNYKFISCDYCGKKGHLSKNCWHNKNKDVD